MSHQFLKDIKPLNTGAICRNKMQERGGKDDKKK